MSEYKIGSKIKMGEFEGTILRDWGDMPDIVNEGEIGGAGWYLIKAPNEELVTVNIYSHKGVCRTRRSSQNYFEGSDGVFYIETGRDVSEDVRTGEWKTEYENTDTIAINKFVYRTSSRSFDKKEFFKEWR